MFGMTLILTATIFTDQLLHYLMKHWPVLCHLHIISERGFISIYYTSAYLIYRCSYSVCNRWTDCHFVTCIYSRLQGGLASMFTQVKYPGTCTLLSILPFVCYLILFHSTLEANIILFTTLHLFKINNLKMFTFMD